VIFFIGSKRQVGYKVVKQFHEDCQIHPILRLKQSQYLTMSYLEQEGYKDVFVNEDSMPRGDGSVVTANRVQSSKICDRQNMNTSFLCIIQNSESSSCYVIGF